MRNEIKINRVYCLWLWYIVFASLALDLTLLPKLIVFASITSILSATSHRIWTQPLLLLFSIYYLE